MDPTPEPDQPLPTWLIPDRATTLALKRENLLTSYDNALDGILNRMVEQHTTFADAVRDDPRGFEPAHLLQWIMRDEGRKVRYYEAQAATARQMAATAHRLNLLAALFLPLTALASVFGMNFNSGLEDSVALFWSVCGVGVAMGLALIIALRKRAE